MFLVARERGTAQLQLQAQLVRLYYKRNNKNLQKQKRFISYMDSKFNNFFYQYEFTFLHIVLCFFTTFYMLYIYHIDFLHIMYKVLYLRLHS